MSNKRKVRVAISIAFIILSIIYLYNKNIKILLVKTGSMEREIEIGDILIIKSEDNYEIGNIITYQTKEKYLITHRIIRREKGGYITKGDNNNIEDNEVIYLDQIMGKVFLNIGNIKKVSLYLIIFILIYILYKFQVRRK